MRHTEKHGTTMKIHFCSNVTELASIKLFSNRNINFDFDSPNKFKYRSSPEIMFFLSEQGRQNDEDYMLGLGLDLGNFSGKKIMPEPIFNNSYQVLLSRVGIEAKSPKQVALRR